ncbi:MAG: tetratricopeptide repeat protein [Magnetococcales bacterium]|nr:tetratricopeptide repeat protein [Magnetococcales bacterium]
MAKNNSNTNEKKTKLTVDSAYAQAIEHFNANRYNEADQLCTAIIQAVPSHVDAINLLGVIAQKINRHDLAIGLFQRAINIDSSRALLYYNLGTSFYQSRRREEAIHALESALKKEPGNTKINDYLNTILSTNEDLQDAVAFHKSGKLVEAMECYKKSLTTDPENPIALCNVGTILREQGLLDEAIASLEKAVSFHPEYGDAYYNLGNTLKDKGELDKAIKAYQKVIEVKPGFATAYNNLGAVLVELGRFDAAIECYQNAMKMNPDSAEIYLNYANVLKKQGRLDEAVECYQKAAVINPGYAETFNSLGNILLDQGMAQEAGVNFKKAIAINTEFAEAYNSLGIAEKEQGKLEEAAYNFKKAVALRPDYADAYYNLGNNLKLQWKFDDAVESYQKAILIRPDYSDAYNNLGATFFEQGKFEKALAKYQEGMMLKKDCSETHSNLILCIDMISSAETDLFQTEREKWAKLHAEPLQVNWSAFSNRPDPGRKLRIGYVGSDFYRHSAAYIFGPMLLNYNPNEFQLFCYAGNRVEDDITAKFKEKTSQWLRTNKLDDESLAKKIRDDKIDILVDLAGHTKGNRLLTFARKPAPIQIMGWGYPHGTCMAAMDYIFADPIFIPQSERGKYTEEIVDLPCVIHLNPDIKFPEIKSPPILENGYITFGAFNRPEKYNQAVYIVWAEILQRIPAARLIIKTGKGYIPQQFEKMYSLFQKKRISSERITIIGKTSTLDHLKSHNQIDIMLDPFPHNGGMTTLESLRMGVPVLTCEKKTRCPTSASILHVLGLDEWRTNDENEYVERAVRFAGEINTLQTLRKNLRNQFDKSALGNSQAYVAAVEASYRKLWKRWCDSNS